MIDLGIHQSHPVTTGQGIQRLPLYLKHTKELYCLFDANYASRMWCIWELAIYLKLRESPKVKFISISRSTLQFIAVLVSILTKVISYLTYIYLHESETDLTEEGWNNKK